MPRHSPTPEAALASAVSATRAGGGGCYLGRAGEAIYAPSEHGVLVLGPPRSGKTTALVTPNVLGADGPVLVASTKLDVLRSTVRGRSLFGRVTAFDPSGSVRLPGEIEIVGWSPLQSARSWSRSVLVADAMVGASRGGGARGELSHWNERASALLAPLLHAAAIGGGSMADVVRAINRRETGEFLATLAREGAELPLDLLTGITDTDPRELSGIYSTASSVLAAYRTGGALESTTRPSLDAAAFCASNDTCFIVGSGEQQRHLAPIVAGFISEVRHAAYARAADERPGRHVLLVLDELANIAPLDDLPSLVAEGAGQGIVTLACLQDLSQARARWGTAADGFLSLFGTKVILPGIGDRRTLESISVLAGDGDVRTRSVTRQRWHRGRSWTEGTRAERRIPPDAIANGPPGSAIVISGAKIERITLTPAHSTSPFDRLATPSFDAAQPRRFRDRQPTRSKGRGRSR